MPLTDYEGVTTSYDPKRLNLPHGLHTAITDEHGERKRTAKFFATTEERDAKIPGAGALLAALRAEIAIEKAKRETVMPALPAAPRGTELFETLALAWLEQIEEDRKASTFRNYRSLLTRHLLPIMRKWPVTDEVMTVAQMVDLLGRQLHARQVGLKQRIKAQRLLSKFFNWVLTSGRVPAKILSQNPVRGLGLNLRQKGETIDPEVEPNPMSHAQRDGFLAWQQARGAACGDPTLYRLFLWLAYQGTRIGEACALQWSGPTIVGSQVNLDTEQAHIKETFSGAQRWKEIRAEKAAGRKGTQGRGLQATKTRQARQFTHLHPAVIEELRLQQQYNREAWLKRGRYGAEPTFVFLNATDSNPLRSDNERIYQAFREGCTALGYVGVDTQEPFTVHDLRATFITCAIRDGHNIGMIARHVGHKGTATIEKYYLRYIQEVEDNPFRKGGRR